MKKDSKIFVAGHRGLVGSAIVRRLQSDGYNNVILRTRLELDLRDQRAVVQFFHEQKPEYVFLSAAKVGGILANNTYPAEFIYQNLMIQNNVIHCAYENGVTRLLFLGSSCIYPRDCPQPIKEEYLLTGPLEITNRSYAVAKIAGIEMCWAYNRQHDTRYMAVMPTNLYGPGDNYDLQKSHVLPAIIRKFHLAKLAKQRDLKGIQEDERNMGPIPLDIKDAMGLSSDSSFLDTTISPRPIFWGTGTARREFLYSLDMADACVFLMSMKENDFSSLISIHKPPLINIGCGSDQTISECVDLIKNVVGYDGDIQWDRGKPDGTPQKLLDINRLTRLGWQPVVGMAEGIEKAYADYQRRVQKYARSY